MLTFAASFVLMAWVFEVCLGWPQPLFKRIAHPVVWIGALINRLDASLNKTLYSASRRKLAGVVTVLIVVGLSTAIAILIGHLLPQTITGFLIQALIASSLLASRSLHQHVNAVYTAFNSYGIASARHAVSQIVGRSTTDMDESAVARATLESLAENTSDGVTAPVFWGLLLGLPGLAAYKAINTLDSMIAHKTPQYLEFGAFAARLDDLVNLIPARLSALLFMAAGSYWSWKSIQIDANAHRSPNAGWPESAMAHALGVRLSGPRRYASGTHQEPWINHSGRDPSASDIRPSLRLYYKAMAMLALLLVFMAAGGRMLFTNDI